jgi:hypothetical protein
MPEQELCHNATSVNTTEDLKAQYPNLSILFDLSLITVDIWGIKLELIQLT